MNGKFSTESAGVYEPSVFLELAIDMNPILEHVNSSLTVTIDFDTNKRW